MRILLMGPPGAGKGTQAGPLARHFSVCAISTGDILRSNVADGTPLGRQAKDLLDAGQYVPDDLTNAMVDSRLGEADCADGYLLDGYPRTLGQVHHLDSWMAERRIALDAVVSLHLDEDELLSRLLERAAIQGRSDDTESVIRRRQAAFNERTRPLLRLYEGRGLLYCIDGAGSIDDVRRRIITTLRARGDSQDH